MSHPHWEYFLSLEADLEQCSRYVAFEEANYSTYSIEFLKIVLAASSETDTVAKELCKVIDSSKKPGNINQYFPIVNSAYPRISEFKIEIPRYKIELYPWENWSGKSSPHWWSRGYNKLKHDRTNHFNQATLQNAIYSVSGLLTLILYFYDAAYEKRPKIDLHNTPKILETAWYGAQNMVDGGLYWDYYVLK